MCKRIIARRKKISQQLLLLERFFCKKLDNTKVIIVKKLQIMR